LRGRLGAAVERPAKEAEREGLFGAAEGEFFETGLHMRQTGAVFDIVETQVQAAHRGEVLQEVEIGGGTPIHIELDIGTVSEESGCTFQVAGRERLVELDHFAFGFERTKGLAERVAFPRVCAEKAAVAGYGLRLVHSPIVAYAL